MIICVFARLAVFSAVVANKSHVFSAAPCTYFIHFLDSSVVTISRIIAVSARLLS